MNYELVQVVQSGSVLLTLLLWNKCYNCVNSVWY